MTSPTPLPQQQTPQENNVCCRQKGDSNTLEGILDKQRSRRTHPPEIEVEGGGDLDSIIVLPPTESVSANTSDCSKKRKDPTASSSSWVSDHFVEDEEQKTKRCQIPGCKKQYSLSASIESLIHHLETAHHIDTSSLDASDPKKRRGGGGCCSPEGQHSSQPQTQTSTSYTGASREEGNDDQQGQEDDQLLQHLIDWCIDCTQPPEAIQRDSFKAICRLLKHAPCSLPSTQELVGAIERSYENQHCQLRKVLQEVIPGRVALSCDGWSSQVSSGFLAVNVHWIDQNWKLRTCVIEYLYIPQPYDGRAIAELIMSILENFNLRTRVRSVTSISDCGLSAAMKTVANQLNSDLLCKLEDDWHVLCINDFMHNALLECQSFLFDAPLIKLRKMLKILHASTSMKHEFHEIQLELECEQISPVPALDHQSCWNSTFQMIEECYELREIFETLCDSDRFGDLLETLPDCEWKILKDCKDFLSPLYDSTMCTGGHYTPLSMQRLFYESFVSHCEKVLDENSEDTDGTLSEAATLMLKEMEKFKIEANLDSKNARLALAMDPSIPDTEEEIAALTQAIRKILAAEYDVTLSRTKGGTVPTFVDNGPDRSLWGNDVLAAGFAARRPKVTSKLGDEVESYFEFVRQQANRCKDSISAIEWWRTIGSKMFPNVALLARDFLMCVGSTLPSPLSEGDMEGQRKRTLCAERTDNYVIGSGNDGMHEKLVKLKSWNYLYDKVDVAVVGGRKSRCDSFG